MRGPAAPQPYAPYLEPVAGAVWWTVGAVGIGTGTGTVVLAAGLGLTGWLVMTLRRRFGSGAPMPRGGRTRLLVHIGLTITVIAVAATLLGMTDYAEAVVPAAAVIVGVALMPLSSQLDERAFVLLGGALMVLGASGVLFALNTAGTVYSHGVVGLVAGALFWLAAAHRTGLLAEVRDRTRS